MAQIGQAALQVTVVDHGWATASVLDLGAVELPFDRGELGSLDLRAHPEIAADILRRAADRLAPRT